MNHMPFLSTVVIVMGFIAFVLLVSMVGRKIYRYYKKHYK